MTHTPEKPRGFTAQLSETLDNYSYSFTPELSPKDVEKLPAHVKRFMAKYIYPGFVFQQRFAKSMHQTMTMNYSGQVYMEREEREAPHPATVRLDISKKISRANVDRLFAMLQESGFNIAVTKEKYQDDESGDAGYKSAVDDITHLTSKKITNTEKKQTSNILKPGKPAMNPNKPGSKK